MRHLLQVRLGKFACKCLERRMIFVVANRFLNCFRISRVIIGNAPACHRLLQFVNLFFL